jgi:peptidoglycan/xylan/chitin deacetylase (PgdA/CDA1 family)
MHGSLAPPFFVTTSWDDGHPSDLRVGELLAKYGLQGTFYVPTVNREGRPVMSGAEIRQLASQFEIGGHTRDHVMLTDLAPAQAEMQIRENRDTLADLLGAPVAGFAYVRGRHNRSSRALVERLGFSYARTTVNFECSLGPDLFRIPTTIQFFPHALQTKLRNLVRRGISCDRMSIMAASVGTKPLSRACLAAAQAARSRGRFFHLWGHSWELDEHELWSELDALLVMLRDLGAQQVSNGGLVERLRGAGVSATYSRATE